MTPDQLPLFESEYGCLADVPLLERLRACEPLLAESKDIDERLALLCAVVAPSLAEGVE